MLIFKLTIQSKKVLNSTNTSDGAVNVERIEPKLLQTTVAL